MKRILLCALVVTLVPSAPNAVACNGEVIEIIVDDGSPGGQGFYLDDRSDGAITINLWVYQEDNGQDGLQSGFTAEFPLWPVWYSDDCWTDYSVTPDRLIL